METLKKIVRNQYFPAGAVLAAVILFWLVGILGGLSLLHNNQPPLTTLTWLLFVYTAAVLTPLAGLLAAIDLVRRWRRNRAGAGPVIGEEPVGDDRPSAEIIVPADDPVQPAAAPVLPAADPYDQARPAVQEKQAKQAKQERPATQPGASKKSPKQPGGRQAA